MFTSIVKDYYSIPPRLSRMDRIQDKIKKERAELEHWLGTGYEQSLFLINLMNEWIDVAYKHYQEWGATSCFFFSFENW
jgi:hypothetical protein